MKTNQVDLDKLGLSPRTYNALCRAGILTIDQLCNTSRKDLRRLKNVGPKMVAEIDEKLAAYIATGAAEMELPPEHPCKLDYVQGYLDYPLVEDRKQQSKESKPEPHNIPPL